MIWKVLVILVFTVIGGGLYGILFTTAPVDLAFSILPAEKFKVSKVDGSLMSGFKLYDLKIDSKELKLELREVGYLNDFSKGLNSNNKIELNSFFAKDGFIKIEKNAHNKVSHKSKKHEKKPSSLKEKKNSSKQKTIKFLLSIVNIDIENIKLTVPPAAGMLAMGPKTYHLKSFKLENFLLDINSKDKYIDLKVGHHSVETEKFRYDFNNIHIQRRHAKWERAKLVLSKEISESLKQDFSIVAHGELSYDFQAKEKFLQTLKPNIKLSAFDDKLKASLNQDLQLYVQASDLSPGDFITTDTPLSNISFKAQGNHIMDVMTGRLSFNDVKFSIGDVVFQKRALDVGRVIASNENSFKYTGYLKEEKIEVELTPSWYAQVFKKKSKLKIQYHSNLELSEFMSSQGVSTSYFATN